MARRDALLRLHKTLLGRREDLLTKLNSDLAEMRDFKASDNTGDSADAAFESGSDEMASQLAEFDSRELRQIERALMRLKQGTYGHCEGEDCGKPIPVARLNALPYTTLCIECQRKAESDPSWRSHSDRGDWDRVFDATKTFEDQKEVKLSELEMDLSK
jgi:DnaK suppressor protein